MYCASPSCAVGPSLAVCEQPTGAFSPASFRLPVLARSATLLGLLLQERALDLELAASVVALDPGLAFGVLRLANASYHAPDEPVWQLSSALVAAGREELCDLLEHAPRLEALDDHGRRSRLVELRRRSVVRACVAHLLARELGCRNEKKCFLLGLLFHLSEMAALAHPQADSREGSGWAPMCDLPVLLGAAKEHGSDVAEPVLAAVLSAQALAVPKRGHSASELAELPAWHCWPRLSRQQRCVLLDRCTALAVWAETNLDRLEPWDFLSRLERHNPWEKSWTRCGH